MDISTGWPKSDIHGNPAKTGLLQLFLVERNFVRFSIMIKSFLIGLESAAWFSKQQYSERL